MKRKWGCEGIPTVDNAAEKCKFNKPFNNQSSWIGDIVINKMQVEYCRSRVVPFSSSAVGNNHTLNSSIT